MKDRIIVALDAVRSDRISSLVTGLLPYTRCFKIGPELITAAGPRIIRRIHSLGGSVFYDVKFNDVPTAVGRASRAAADLGVAAMSVHASAGINAMASVVGGKGNAFVFAATVLTSMEDHECRLTFGMSLRGRVLCFARNAKSAGCDGIICSAEDLSFFHGERPDGLLRITSGIRPDWAPLNDHHRVLTPAEAVRSGATHLVIGRPITDPPSGIGMPADAVKRIAEEVFAETEVYR